MGLPTGVLTPRRPPTRTTSLGYCLGHPHNVGVGCVDATAKPMACTLRWRHSPPICPHPYWRTYSASPLVPRPAGAPSPPATTPNTSPPLSNIHPADTPHCAVSRRGPSPSPCSHSRAGPARRARCRRQRPGCHPAPGSIGAADTHSAAPQSEQVRIARPRVTPTCAGLIFVGNSLHPSRWPPARHAAHAPQRRVPRARSRPPDALRDDLGPLPQAR